MRRCVILWWSVAVVFWLFMTASMLENVFLVIILAFHAMLNIMVIDCIPSWSFYPIVIITSHHDHCIPSWSLCPPIMTIASHHDLCIISWPLHPIMIILYITSWLLHPIMTIPSHCGHYIPLWSLNPTIIKLSRHIHCIPLWSLHIYMIIASNHNQCISPWSLLPSWSVIDSHSPRAQCHFTAERGSVFVGLLLFCTIYIWEIWHLLLFVSTQSVSFTYYVDVESNFFVK